MNVIQKHLAAFVPRFIGAGTVVRFLSFVSVRIPTSVRNAHLAANSVAWNQVWKTTMTGPYIERQGCLATLRLGRTSADRNSCEVIAAYNALAALSAEEADWAKKPQMSLRYPWLPVTRRRSFPEMIWEFESLGLALAGYFGTAPAKLIKYLGKQGYETAILYGKRINPEHIRQLTESYRTFILTAYNDRDNLMAQIHTVSITREAYGFRVHNAHMEKEIFPKLQEAVEAFGHGKGGPICLIGAGSR